MKKILYWLLLFIIPFELSATLYMLPPKKTLGSINFSQGTLDVNNTFILNDNEFKIDKDVTTLEFNFTYKDFFKTYEELEKEFITKGYFFGFSYNSYDFESEYLIKSQELKKLKFKIHCAHFLIGTDFHIESINTYIRSAFKLSSFQSNESIITKVDSQLLKKAPYKIEEFENNYFQVFQSSFIIGLGYQVFQSGHGINLDINYEIGLIQNKYMNFNRYNLGISYVFDL